MSDTISRRQAIEALRRNQEAYLHDNYFDKIVETDIETLTDLPSAQPEKRTEERTETHACDCIERQAAIDAHYEYCNKHPDAGFPVWSLKILEDLPSAQPEIVRCKDCKYWMPHSQLGYDEDNETYHDYCKNLIPEDEYYAFYRCADDYCSLAERRTDEQTD